MGLSRRGFSPQSRQSKTFLPHNLEHRVFTEPRTEKLRWGELLPNILGRGMLPYPLAPGGIYVAAPLYRVNGALLSRM